MLVAESALDFKHKAKSRENKKHFYMQSFPSIVFRMFAFFKILVKGSQDVGANNNLADIISYIQALTFLLFVLI